MSHADAVWSIVYAWGIAFSPHVIKLAVLGSGGYKWDNTIGRYNMSKDTKALRASPHIVERAKRADAAHQNGMESFPLFAVAVLTAISSGVEPKNIKGLTNAYLALRVIYNIIFIVGGGEGVAAVRTLIWGSSVYTSISLLIKSARVLAADGH